MEFNDRSKGLKVFGLLTILGGVFCTLLTLLTILFAVLVPKRPESLQGDEVVPLVAMYGALAIALVWLGIGSIKGRRWARALLLVFAWIGLVVGVCSAGFITSLSPRFVDAMKSVRPGAQAPDAGQITVAITILVLIYFFFVVLPLTWVLFYGSKHVEATCDARDQKIRWTDRCPLPVLAVSVWLAFGALDDLAMPFSNRGVFPFFGQFLSGPIGTAVYFILAVIWGYSAYAIYKLDRHGWWIIFVALCLFGVSQAITYSMHNSAELLQLSGYSAERVARMQSSRFFMRNSMAWTSLTYTVPALAYLLYVRRFLHRTHGDRVDAARAL